MSNTFPYLVSAPSALALEPAKRTFYVLVRKDISQAQQMVQAVHAAAEAARQHYRPEQGIASAIVLEVADQAALHRAREQLARKGIQTELFFEPDFGIGDSALATEPLPDEQRKHLRGWPLWAAAASLKEAA